MTDSGRVILYKLDNETLADPILQTNNLANVTGTIPP